MRIPKEINQALNNKAKYYELAVCYGYIVDDFLDENDIEVEDCDRATGCEAIVNPKLSIKNIKEAIKEK